MLNGCVWSADKMSNIFQSNFIVNFYPLTANINCCGSFFNVYESRQSFSKGKYIDHIIELDNWIISILNELKNEIKTIRSQFQFQFQFICFVFLFVEFRVHWISFFGQGTYTKQTFSVYKSVMSNEYFQTINYFLIRVTYAPKWFCWCYVVVGTLQIFNSTEFIDSKTHFTRFRIGQREKPIKTTKIHTIIFRNSKSEERRPKSHIFSCMIQE